MMKQSMVKNIIVLWTGGLTMSGVEPRHYVGGFVLSIFTMTATYLLLALLDNRYQWRPITQLPPLGQWKFGTVSIGMLSERMLVHDAIYGYTIAKYFEFDQDTGKRAEAKGSKNSGWLSDDEKVLENVTHWVPLRMP